MKENIVFMFSGQGSQYIQAGKELYRSYPVFHQWMLQMDRWVQDIGGRSIIQELYDSNRSYSDVFEETLITHPAIYMLEYALARTLMERGVIPTTVVGTSLGEFAAAAVSNVMTPKAGLEAVYRQAEIMHRTCTPGGMLAVLHSRDVYDTNPELYGECELIAVNSSNHLVISGSLRGVTRAESWLKNQGLSYVRLPVTQGFHSACINPAAKEYLAYLNTQSYNVPTIPLVSSLTGQPVTKVSTDHFWRVVKEPIQFSQALSHIREEKPNSIFLDLGPSGTLSSLVNQISPRKERTCITMTPFHQDVKHVEQIISCYANSNETGGDEPLWAYVFPGQGSQKLGMGEGLFEQFPELTRQADDILGYSIRELCMYDRSQQLSLTEYTQPALFVVNAMTYLHKIKETGRKPSLVSGHSLGEYNALFAADVFDFATGLKLVRKRGELMSKAPKGGMAAVIGLTDIAIKKILQQYGLHQLDIANLNSPTQIVLAGPLEIIDQAKTIFEQTGAQMYIPLRVSGAFHSRYMEQSAKQFEQYLQRYSFSAPTMTIISNYTAMPYRLNEIHGNLVQQITHPVRWCETVRVLMGMGVNTIEEIGPGNVLTKLVTKIQTECEPIVYRPDHMSVEPSPSAVHSTSPTSSAIQPGSKGTRLSESLGSKQFKKDYNLKWAYLTGAMYKGIASPEMVVKVGQSGMMGFLGTGGLSLKQIEEGIDYIQQHLQDGQAYGLNLLHQMTHPEREEEQVNLLLRKGVHTVEASAFMGVTPALIQYRAHGLKRSSDGRVTATNRIIAKVSRPEVAEVFLSPAPEFMVERLLKENKITSAQAELLKKVPVAEDLCLESDSGGHTDAGVAYVMLPAIVRLRNRMMEKYSYSRNICIGAGGGIGTPEAAAAAFLLGADFIVTGSINQCTVEAATSDTVKDLLQDMNIQDTEYAPAGDMFEIGAKVQVLRKGVFFPARANKLYDLYRQHDSLNDISEKNKQQLENKYFKKTFEEVYREVVQYRSLEEIQKAEQNPKYKMALVFKWYFAHSTKLAMEGAKGHQVDYQIHCGPALGAFNQWVKGTPLEDWRNRRVAEVGIKLMEDTALVLEERLKQLAVAVEIN
ncbi:MULTISPECIES: ACP S-malonyltransferase [unclassified Paenibacillus]|uniref:ACP S-malonyltransferase n=1 Tax=unclassified Paenibacillus TaxID=185978 RepID=UPI000403E010|nr:MULTISPECIES: ACP S-malonyltransferase [unclassified Paenibacillus]KGP80542.1 malonyl CoA-acyl carrier protein transacylase [Paenibacillus sp. MAEPY2]KGP86477.1 malonyl CoA-acyl carrier protein transacylase [Paenibacillus sp. MAEPY1]